MRCVMQMGCDKRGVECRPMDWCGEKALNGAVATRTPARDIAHGDVLRRTQRPGDDGTELTQHGGGMDLTKGAKQCEDIHGFSFWG